jgi:hypothetical protein
LRHAAEIGFDLPPALRAQKDREAFGEEVEPAEVTGLRDIIGAGVVPAVEEEADGGDDVVDAGIIEDVGEFTLDDEAELDLSGFNLDDGPAIDDDAHED